MAMPVPIRNVQAEDVIVTSGRRYYSVRTGRYAGTENLDFNWLSKIVLSIFDYFRQLQYFDESFGTICVDGDCDGAIGGDHATYAFIAFRRGGLFPIEREKTYTEDDCFDIIEFLYDHVSKPLSGVYHDYDRCGWHYDKFDNAAGREEFREKVNTILLDYKDGWELTAAGEMQSCAEPGMETLLSASLPIIDDKNVNKRVEASISKFRRRSSTPEDRRDAVRDLADVLEFLRDDVKKALASKDESDLFQIANKFGIRHHNNNQQTDYDLSIWLSWMFYYYLATIHAAVRLIQRGANTP